MEAVLKGLCAEGRRLGLPFLRAGNGVCAAQHHRDVALEKAHDDGVVVVLEQIAGRKVVKADDFTKPELTGLPSSNVLRYTLEDETWVTVRPSGTEPKLKLYIGAHAENEEKCDAILAEVIADIDGTLSGWLN